MNVCQVSLGMEWKLILLVMDRIPWVPVGASKCLGTVVYYKNT